MSPFRGTQIAISAMIATLSVQLQAGSDIPQATPKSSAKASPALGVKPASPARFLGEPIALRITITNNTSKVLPVLRHSQMLHVLREHYQFRGRKSGVVKVRGLLRGVSRPVLLWAGKLAKYDYSEIPPHGMLSFPITLQGDLLWDPPEADTYTLTAVLPLKDGRKIRGVCSFVVKAVPELKDSRHFRFQRGTPAVHDFVGVDLGFAQTGKRKERTLFCVVRQSELGKSKFRQPPERTFRLMQADANAEFETMVYNPFPLADDPIIEVHVLVTEPNKPQRYFVVDLSLGATLKNKQTLKPGALYKLHKEPLGSVKLVPR